MASAQHQFICGLLVRKMATYGYVELISFDGTVRGGYFGEFPVPETVGRHRPDCISINKNGNKAIGEAKTVNDLVSERTYEEILDFTTICMNDPSFDLVFLGFPEEGELYFEQLFDKLPENNRQYVVPMRYYSELDDCDEF